MSEPEPIRIVGAPGRGPECCSPATPRMELLSPSNVKDRSQNVTEKVTQVLVVVVRVVVVGGRGFGWGEHSQKRALAKCPKDSSRRKVKLQIIIHYYN